MSVAVELPRAHWEAVLAAMSWQLPTPEAPCNDRAFIHSHRCFDANQAIHRALGHEMLEPTEAQILPPLTFADLTVDLLTRGVERAGREVQLTRKEFDVLAFFMARPRRVLSPVRVYSGVWGVDLSETSNAFGVVIATLRQKLGSPPILQTVRGVGYVLREERAGR